MPAVLQRVTAVILCLFSTVGVQAGLYYSGEAFSELPSQWQGFLLDHRMLRLIALKPRAGLRASTERLKYQQASTKLTQLATKRPLTASEEADRGALAIRLGEIDKAVEILRTSQRQFPEDFHIIANLGTAYQLQGDWVQATACLQQAVRRAPAPLRKAEQYHLKLAQLRQRQARGEVELDDLFGVRYIGDNQKYEPGKLAQEQSKRLPAEATAILQQLALWLPADGQLLWQLAELAAVQGDVKMAAAMMDGCVTEFNMRSKDLRQHRQLCRATADKLRRAPVDGNQGGHGGSGHVGTGKPRSTRPLLRRVDPSTLPPIRAKGTNPIPWLLLGETTVDRKFKATFPKHLQQLDGKQVVMSGFMQPLGDPVGITTFMLIEYPVGCWYCEMPPITGLVTVELPPNQTTTLTNGLIKVVGRLSLNADNPENFLFTITQAKVVQAD